jgi:Na+/H+-dicarboxylate symporter
MFRSLSVRVLIALVLGLGAGAAIAASGSAPLARVVEFLEPFGGLWLNALRMTVVPLVFSVLVVGVASVADAAATGRLAVRAIVLFTALIFAAALYTTLATHGLLAIWPLEPEGARALIAGASGTPPPEVQPQGFGEWIRSLAPPNPLAAAAEDAVLPLVVFSVFFGFAVTRLPAELRDPLVTVFRGVTEAMVVIVRWVLWAAPVGVFALSLGVGLRAGLGAAGIVAQYVIIVSLVTAGVTLLALAMGIVFGRVPPARFLRAMTPVLAVAFSTQSSLASLPLMIERSQDDLGIPPRVTGVVLPLAVAVFRFTSPVANLAVAYFTARVFGLEPSLAQIGAAIVVAYAVSVASVGLPGQVSFFLAMVPICVALGVPVVLLPIFLAVEVIPDIFRTLGNVSGDMAVNAILGRDAREPVADPMEPAAV